MSDPDHIPTRLLSKLQQNPEEPDGIFAEDAHGLLRILESSEDLELKLSAARALARIEMDDQDARELLINGLEKIFRAESSLKLITELKKAVNHLRAQSILGEDPILSLLPGLSEQDQKRLSDSFHQFQESYRVEHAQSFQERYQIQRLLEQGGMGVIFKARRTKDDQIVAVKIVLEKFLDQPRIIKRFERESEILLQLDHPNIVKILERGHYQGKPYIIMEYIDGGDLDQLIAQGPMDYSQAINILDQVCSALQYVHDHKIVHRDLKPGNVLITQQGTAKLTDFGLARDLRQTSLTQFSDQLYTPGYSSPEQRQSPKEVDHRGDIYSLGVMIYAMLSGGRLPEIDYQPLSELRRELPPNLDEIIKKCLKRKPGQRYQEVREIREALQKTGQND